jgi:hypothetical protein
MAAEARFEAKAREMHPEASEAEIAAVAESLRKAHYTRLGLRSAQARRKRSSKGIGDGEQER